MKRREILPFLCLRKIRRARAVEEESTSKCLILLALKIRKVAKKIII
jgi:hypothetical protein